jgi:serine/threonine protein kinase
VSSTLQEQLQRALGEAYLLERELGGGGMSRVFVALDRALGRKVVVKVLLPELTAAVNVERFRREIQLAAQLQHPHIVPLLSAGEADGLPYFIMPFVTGESLRARVAREGEFPVAETVRILRDVGSALAYAHGNGVIHRDVKPDNVLLSGGVAVVTDFGVAKAVSASAGTGTGLTSLGVALGTPAYMAPEQATASPNIDHRADLYSLGVVASEMLTGHPPFGGRSAQQMLAAHVIEEPEPVERRRPAVPPMLAALVRDCLAKRPADRPQTASQVMHLLDAIATPSGGTSATTAVRLPVHSEPSARKRKWLVPAALLALVLLLAGGAMWLRRTSQAAIPLPGASASADTGLAVPSPQPAAVAPPAAPSPVTADAPRSKTTRRERPRAEPAKPAPAVVPESLAVTAAAEPPLATPPAPLLPAVTAPPVAPAPPPAKAADHAAEIRGVIAEYAQAIEGKSLPGLQRAYPAMTGLQARGWEQFFQLVRDVKARLSIAALDVSGGTADAQVTGTYTYLNTSTGRTESQPVSFHASFRNEGGKWRISQVR